MGGGCWWLAELGQGAADAQNKKILFFYFGQGWATLVRTKFVGSAKNIFQIFLFYREICPSQPKMEGVHTFSLQNTPLFTPAVRFPYKMRQIHKNTFL
jgi:hypothetical protein